MARSRTGYGELAGESDVEALSCMVAEAFGGSVEPSAQWVVSNVDGVRVWRRGGKVIAGLLLIPMGQFFAGRSVPMTGVAGVCVPPGERGKGTAAALMAAALAEMRQSGVPLSSLYPATLPLYRRVGYEIAGGRYRIKVPARDAGARADGTTARAMTEADIPRVEQLYREHAALRPGWLDRGPYVWHRLRRAGERVVRGYVVGDRRIEGYAYIEQVPYEKGYDLVCRDLVAVNAAAYARLMALLRSFRSLGRDVIYHGSTDDPWVHLLDECGAEISLVQHWMLRVVDVRRALAARAYPAGVRARLELDVRDNLLRGNRGKIALDVGEGAATVRAGGKGSIGIDVRALAALYSGFLGARRLASLGLIAGSERALAEAEAVFSGPPPSCPDGF